MAGRSFAQTKERACTCKMRSALPTPRHTQQDISGARLVASHMQQKVVTSFLQSSRREQKCRQLSMNQLRLPILQPSLKMVISLKLVSESGRELPNIPKF